jgi:Flp pilus assembly pilin Flp
MTGVVCLLERLVADESGQDIIEYALLAGLVGTAGFSVLPTIVTQMSTAYQSWISGASAAWEPCAPALGPCP